MGRLFYWSIERQYPDGAAELILWTIPQWIDRPLSMDQRIVNLTAPSEQAMTKRGAERVTPPQGITFRQERQLREWMRYPKMERNHV